MDVQIKSGNQKAYSPSVNLMFLRFASSPIFKTTGNKILEDIVSGILNPISKLYQ